MLEWIDELVERLKRLQEIGSGLGHGYQTELDLAEGVKNLEKAGWPIHYLSRTVMDVDRYVIVTEWPDGGKVGTLRQHDRLPRGSTGKGAARGHLESRLLLAD